jgi:hypothetical protein
VCVRDQPCSMPQRPAKMTGQPGRKAEAQPTGLAVWPVPWAFKMQAPVHASMRPSMHPSMRPPWSQRPEGRRAMGEGRPEAGRLGTEEELRASKERAV